MLKKGSKKDCPVVVITRETKVLMGLRHYTQDKWKEVSVWTLPGGRCDESESIGETLLREVAEETGITDLSVTGFLGEVDGAKEGDRVHVFVGTTTKEPKLMEPEKFSEWKWVDLCSVPDNFINPSALKLIRSSICI